MNKKTLKDTNVKGKMVFLRVDFNVPLEGGVITDDTRIQASLPTLRHLIEKGARIICASHLGRPSGDKDPEFSLAPVARHLSSLLGQNVQFTGEVTGPKVEAVKSRLEPGQVLLLENLRYIKGETKNDAAFAAELARGVDVYVNDAFGASHRAHASIQKITELTPAAVSGFLLEKEIHFLSLAVHNPPEKYYAILGGAKVSDKIPVIANLIGKARKIFIGGAMAYSFLKVQGHDVGKSMIEAEMFDTCRDILKKAKENNVQIFLPVDHIAAHSIEQEVTIRMIKQGEEIPEEMMGLDIGFETIKLFSHELKDAEMIVWNGPMGVFEIETFSAGTMEIAKAVAGSAAISVVGGGDSVSAVNKAGVAEKITHISTGGGASLEFLSGLSLPGVESLTEAS